MSRAQVPGPRRQGQGVGTPGLEGGFLWGLALALWLAVAGPTLAGPDEPPLPGTAQSVVAGPGAAAATSANSDGAAGELRLKATDVPATWSLGDGPSKREVTTRELLADPARVMLDLEQLREQVAKDVAIASARLGVDLETRNALRSLDGRYIALQGALTVRGDAERSRIAVFDTSQGLATTLAEIYGANLSPPRRFGFISRIDAANSHSAAGDLYVDREAGIVSLVLWDSMGAGADQFVASLAAAIKGVPGSPPTRLVTSYRPSAVLTLSTGCWQCALRFVDEMLEQDHHTVQIAQALPLGQGQSFAHVQTPGNGSLPARSLQMTVGRSTLLTMLMPRVKELSEQFAAGIIGLDDLDRGMAEVKAIMLAVQQERTERRQPLADPASTETKLYNLRIDRLRARDLTAIQAALRDRPQAFLEAARDLNRDVLREAVEAGGRQRTRLTGAVEPAHPAANQLLDAAATSNHDAARATTAAQHASEVPYDFVELLTDSDDDEVGFLPGSAAPEDQGHGFEDEGFMPAVVNDENVIARHEVAGTQEDELRRLVEKTFDEIGAELRGERERADPGPNEATGRIEPEPAL